jgi:hypothetical protein
VSPFGQGANGVGGTGNNTNVWNQPANGGGGGSGGGNGGNNTGYNYSLGNNIVTSSAGNAGQYGGAPGVAAYYLLDENENIVQVLEQRGANSQGCCRIMWGPGRAFPSTNAGNF